jgi:hypothetical protein
MRDERADAILEEIEVIEASLERMKRELQGDAADVDSKFEVFADVYEEGGVVSRERWHEIGREHGYDDPRGLAGLFAHGKWVEKILGDQVALTADAERQLEAMGLVSD